MTDDVDLLATGTLTWETSALVDRLPSDDRVDMAGVEALLAGARQIVEGGGGSAANVAVAAARAGLRVAFAGRVGDDGDGRRCIRALEAEGIDVRVERMPGRRTKRSVLLVETQTARVQFRVDVPPRAAPPLPAQGVDESLLRGARWLHLDRVSEAAPDLLRRRPIGPTSLDLHDPPHRPAARDRLEGLIPHLALLQVRESALPGLVDPAAAGPVGDPVDAAAALRRRVDALAARVPRVVVTRGALGALAAERGAPAFDVPTVDAGSVVDPTGAGDSFAAALIVALLQGLPLREACARAARAGSRCCGWLGARGPA